MVPSPKPSWSSTDSLAELYALCASLGVRIAAMTTPRKAELRQARDELLSALTKFRRQLTIAQGTKGKKPR